MSVVLTETVEGDLLYVTLNRPEKLNAINAELLDELIEVFRAVNLSRTIRAVVITGAGKGFCAGADLTEAAAPGDIPGTAGMGELGFVYKFQEHLARAVLAIHECDKPVIAAINGAAVGGGLAFALACDLRIATTKAKFGSAFIKTGLSSCDVGTSYFLPRLIPPTKAMELMMSGRIFGAAEADSMGLLNKVVQPEELGHQCQALAASITVNAEYGVWMTKKGFWQNIDAAGLRPAMELENRTQALGYFTGSMNAMREAFAKGEEPDWPTL